jgi:RNA polymerase sigma factor (sigma-70 family)
MVKTILEVVRDLGRAARLQAALMLSDAQLLERFALQRDEAAFEALLHRHGPPVFGVCRRLLYDAHDAEDAFQATFLVLARKAGGIDRRSLLGNWLYGVASRIASRARKNACRRQGKRCDFDLNAVPGAETSAEPDVAFLLHEEVQRLPDKYRGPVVLCYLEGQTNEEAATRLQWPVGTVKTRLTKARVVAFAPGPARRNAHGRAAGREHADGSDAGRVTRRDVPSRAVLRSRQYGCRRRLRSGTRPFNRSVTNHVAHQTEDGRGRDLVRRRHLRGPRLQGLGRRADRQGRPKDRQAEGG